MEKRSLAVLFAIVIASVTVAATGCGKNDNDDSRDKRHTERSIQTEESIEEDTESASKTKEPSEASLEPSEDTTPTATPVIDSSNFKVSKINAFTSVDMDGNTVTEDIFKNADYTMINLWGTFCGPCINEMPELEEIHKSLPDNIQMIGIISDVYPDYDYSLQDAKDIISQTGVTYTNIMCTYDLSNDFAKLMYVPTTIFVDSEGNVVCEVIEGASIQAYKDQIAALTGN